MSTVIFGKFWFITFFYVTQKWGFCYAVEKKKFFVALYGDENPNAQGISDMKNNVSVFYLCFKNFCNLLITENQL